MLFQKNNEGGQAGKPAVGAQSQSLSEEGIVWGAYAGGVG